MMTYDQRIAATEEWMADPGSLFRRRTPSSRLRGANQEDTDARQNGELAIIAEAIVRAAPAGLGVTAFRELLDAAGR